jgi:hypothetical protein
LGRSDLAPSGLLKGLMNEPLEVAKIAQRELRQPFWTTRCGSFEEQVLRRTDEPKRAGSRSGNIEVSFANAFTLGVNDANIAGTQPSQDQDFCSVARKRSSTRETKRTERLTPCRAGFVSHRSFVESVHPMALPSATVTNCGYSPNSPARMGISAFGLWTT